MPEAFDEVLAFRSPRDKTVEVTGVRSTLIAVSRHGIRHYTARDAMSLGKYEMNAIGEDVSLRTQKTFIGTLGKAASGAGATPWLLMLSMHRIWDRMFQGGDAAVYKIGEKEALVLIVGCPPLALTYFRVALLAYYRALARILARVAYTNEVPAHRGPAQVGFRVSWV